MNEPDLNVPDATNLKLKQHFQMISTLAGNMKIISASIATLVRGQKETNDRLGKLEASLGAKLDTGNKTRNIIGFGAGILYLLKMLFENAHNIDFNTIHQAMQLINGGQ